MMEIQRIGLVEAREKLTELIKTAQIKGQRYILEHHQRPAAVLLGYKDFEDLMEIIRELNVLFYFGKRSSVPDKHT